MRFYRYRDTSGLWRWRLYAANNRVIADSGEGYGSLSDCDHAIGLIKRFGPDAPLS